MFGFSKQSFDTDLIQSLPSISGNSNFTVTPEDVAWGNKFYKAAQKKSSDKARALLHKALIEQDRARIAIGLLIQKQFPERDFLYGGHPTRLYTRAWDAPVDITEMYINTYYPTSVEFSWSSLKPCFDELSAATCMKWVESGCGQYTNMVFYSLVRNGTAAQIETFYEAEENPLTEASSYKFDINWKDSLFLLEALKRQEPEIIKAVLSKKPDLKTDTLLFLKLALEDDNPEALKLLIESDINVLTRDEAIFSIAQDKKRSEHLNILKAAKRESIARHGIKTPCKASDGWTALSNDVIEYKRPKSPDGSQTKYQFDFDTGYMSYHYKAGKGKKQTATVLKTIGEAYAENAQLVERAVKALTSLDRPAPDLHRFFNQSGAKPVRNIEKSPGPQPLRPKPPVK